MKVQIAVSIISDVLVNISAGLIMASWVSPLMLLDKKVRISVVIHSLTVAMILLQITYIIQI